MRNISFNVYSINELPQSAQKAAIEQYRWDICDNVMECFSSDYSRGYKNGVAVVHENMRNILGIK